MRIFSFLLFSLIIQARSISAQTVDITGATSPNLGAQEYYEASFDYTLNIYTNINWSVSGGTIVSQSINPTATIWCIVEWDNLPCAGSLSIYEDLGGGYKETPIDVGNYSLIADILASPGNRSTVNCNSSSTSTCNYFLNSNFTPTTGYNYLDPFTLGHITNWTSSHGSPQIEDYFHPTLQAPAPATGFAYMYAQNLSSGISGEGIAQKIPPLTQNTNYKLSFYMRFSPWTGSPIGASALDHLYFAFIHCSDFNSFPNGSNVRPSFPTNSQIVYHGTSISNQGWTLVEVTFTANDSYNMMWVFPDQINSGGCGIDFAYPVLTEIPNYAIATPIGPITLYNWYDGVETVVLTCSSASNYQWYKNNVTISGATNSTYTIIATGSQTSTDYYKCVTSCGTTNTITFNYVGCTSHTQYAGTVPPYGDCESSFPLYISQPNLGSGAEYYWTQVSVTGCFNFSGITSINDNDGFWNIIPPLCTNYNAGILTRALATNGSEIRMSFNGSPDVNCRFGRGTERNIERLEKTQHQVLISPNPAKYNIKINYPLEILEVVIHNALGKRMKIIQPKEILKEIDVRDLIPGLYFLTIKTKVGTKTEKFIIQK